MNRDVFSLFALDSYNRGYGENVKNLPPSGSIGGATIITDALRRLDPEDVLKCRFLRHRLQLEW